MKKIILLILTVALLLTCLQGFALASISVDITDAESYKRDHLSGNNLEFSAKITGGIGVTFNIDILALEKFYYDSDIRYYTFTFNDLTVRADKNSFFDFALEKVSFDLSGSGFAVTYHYKDYSTKKLDTAALDLRYTVSGKDFKAHTVANMGGETIKATECKDGKFVFVTKKLGSFTVHTFEFDDVKDPKAWYYEYVNTAGAYGIISGTGDGKFVPGRNVTRAELATLMVEATKHILEYKINPEITFTDVAQNAWYSEYVYKCASLGLMNGVGEGKFNPGGVATRQEIAELTANLVRLVGGYNGQALPQINESEIEKELSSVYGDASAVHAWARESVLLCQKLAIMEGSDGVFSPLRNITRAESAKIFNDLYFKAVI